MPCIEVNSSCLFFPFTILDIQVFDNKHTPAACTKHTTHKQITCMHKNMLHINNIFNFCIFLFSTFKIIHFFFCLKQTLTFGKHTFPLGKVDIIKTQL